jgi:cytochrome c oxidase cbb3-type subunit 3/ubiquinol-cytochrome c reductase cytochrome c subunit
MMLVEKYPRETLLMALALLAVGCADPLPGKPLRSERAIPLSEQMTFPELYSVNCTGCHGVKGKLGPAPSLNDPLFLSIFSDKQLLDILHNGRPGTLMPAFSRKEGGLLSDAQIKVLATGIRSQWATGKNVPANPPPYLATSPGDPTAGKKKFATYCADCHGTDGQGSTKGAGAVNNPAFLELISDQALRRIIITGRTDLGMPNYVGLGEKSSQKQPLSSQDISDIVALMGTWRTAPARALMKQEKQDQPTPKTSSSGAEQPQPTGTTP